MTDEERKARNRAYNHQYRMRHGDKIRLRLAEWQAAHPKEMQIYRDKWDDAHVAERRAYNAMWMSNKYKTDIAHNIRNRMSGLITHSLKGKVKKSSWELLVDYTKKDLVKHLGKTIPKGYTWDDYLKGKLHIDHIVPITAFNITDEKCIDFKKCWGLNNLQFLPAHDNLVKQAKLEQPFQPSLAMAV
jgi:hypothetical protein